MSESGAAWTLTRREAAGDAIAYEVAVSGAPAAFEGHFPGRPLLLGMAQLVLVEDALRAALDPALRLVEVPQAKFRAPVGPGARLALELRPLDGEGLFAFRLGLGESCAAEGRVRARATGAP